MTLNIHLFARARELAGSESVPLELAAGATVAKMRALLTERVPALAELLLVSAIAVNHEFAEDSQGLHPGDEIAVIPPVSGGSHFLIN